MYTVSFFTCNCFLVYDLNFNQFRLFWTNDRKTKKNHITKWTMRLKPNVCVCIKHISGACAWTNAFYINKHTHTHHVKSSTVKTIASPFSSLSLSLCDFFFFNLFFFSLIMRSATTHPLPAHSCPPIWWAPCQTFKV